MSPRHLDPSPVSPRATTAGALALRICPSGVLWLDSAGLIHPGDRRTMRVPFSFVSGRVGNNGPSQRSASEIELVILAAAAAESDWDIKTDLISYARFVVATAATLDARLAGTTLEAWAAQRPTH